MNTETKNNYINLFIFFLILNLISCKPNKVNNNNSIKDNVSKNNVLKKIIIKKIRNKKIIHIQDIITDYKFIQLENDTNARIVKINRLIFCCNKIFIFDSEQNTLFIFNDNGDFFNKIDNIGRGPDEYLQIIDFSVLKDKKSIFLLVSKGYRQSLFEYNLDKVELINKYNISFTGEYMISYNGNIHIYTDYYTCNRLGYNIYVLSSQGKIIKKLEPFKKRKYNASSFLPENTFFINNKRLFYRPIFSDTIFQFNGTGFYPFLVIKYSDNYITEELSKMYRNEPIDVLIRKMNTYKYTSIDNLLLYGEYAFFSYIENENDNMVFFDMKNNILYKPELEFNIYEGDNSFLETYFFSPVTTTNSWLITTISPYELHDYVNYLKDHLSEKQLSEFLENNDLVNELFLSTTYDDNPILIKYKIHGYK